MKFINWFYDDSGYYTYVLLDGPNELFKEIQTRFNAQNMQILQSGGSFRPSVNGRQYDWYIRTDASFESVKGVFDRFLDTSRSIQQSVRNDSDNPEDILRALREDPQLIIKVLEYLERKKREITELQESHNALQNRYQNMANELQEIRKRNQQLLRDSPNVEMTDMSDSSLDLQQSDKKNEIDDWIAEVEDRENKIVRLKNRIEELKHEKLQLEQEFHDSHRLDSPSVTANSSEKLFHKLLQILAKDIVFLRNSLQYLWNEIEDPTKAIEIAANLAANTGEKRKKVRGVDGWYESTRLHDKSRLYYRRDKDNGKLEVLVSAKQEQNLDINWLKTQ